MKKFGRKAIVIGAVLLVLAIVSGTAAYGYFFSGQTIENNKVKTGKISLQLNDGGTVIPINLDDGVNDIMPGYAGTVGNYKVENTGNVAGSLYVGITPNGEWDSNLGDVLLSAIWLDADLSDSWTSGDAYFVPNGPNVAWAAGDTVGVPPAAYKPFNEFRNALSNTLNIPGHSVAGILRLSFTLPSDVVDTPEKPLMDKSCNFNLMVQIDQYHPLAYTATVGASTHWGADWAAYQSGVMVDAGVIEQDNPGTVNVFENSITLPAGVYDIVFTQGAWTWTKHIDLSIMNQVFDTP